MTVHANVNMEMTLDPATDTLGAVDEGMRASRGDGHHRNGWCR